MNASPYFVAHWRDNSGTRPVVAKRGRKHFTMVTQDFPVCIRIMPVSDERNLIAFDYPIRKAVRKMLHFGRNGNITQGARDMLKDADRVAQEDNTPE